MAIRSSENLKSTIKGFEGFLATAKPDTNGVLSLGYGITSPKWKKGQKITQEQAEADMANRIAEAEAELSSVIQVDLPQERQDVLLDTHYNMGLPTMQKHGLIDLVNAGDFDGVAAKLKKLNKAKIADTGEYKAIGNLPERADWRYNSWIGVPAPEAQPQSIADELAGLMDNPNAGNDTEATTVQNSQDTANTQGVDDLASELAALAPPTKRDVKAEFDLATDVSNEDELERDTKAKALSKQYGISTEEAGLLLDNNDENTVRTKLESESIKDSFPSTTKWAADKNNNALLKKTGNYAKKVEASTVNLVKSDIEKAFASQVVQFGKGIALIKVLNSEVGREEGIATLRRYDQLQKENQNTSEGYQKVQASLADFQARFGQSITNFSELPLDKGTTENLLTVLKTVGTGTFETADAVLGYLSAAVQNPVDAFNFMAESTALPVVSGAAASIAGPISGAAVGGSVGAITAYAGRAQSYFESFRDPKTGEIDYEAFFADPIRVNTARKDANVYAPIIGSAEAAFSFIGGKFFGKLVPKNPVAAAVTSIAGGVASEAGGEAAAQVGGKLASGQEVNVAEVAVEAATEGLVAGPLTAVGTATQGTVRILKEKGASKTVAKIEAATKANKDAARLSELKAVVKENPAILENADQVAELINTTIEDNSVTSQDPIPGNKTVDPSELESSIIERNIVKESETGVVSIIPSEWESFHVERGLDPYSELRKFSPEVQQAYSFAKDADSPITIPLADWIIATEENGELELLPRVGGNEFNALQGSEINTAFEQDPLVLFDTEETSDSMEDNVEANEPPPFGEVVQGEGSTPLRPLDLTSQFATLEDQDAFDNFRRRLKRSLPNTIGQNVVDDIATINLRNLNLRSKVAGVPLAQALDRIQFGKTNKRSNVVLPTPDSDFFSVAFNKEATPTTAIHELSHIFLYGMAEDFQLLRDLDLNTVQGDIRAYREAMDTASELLGLESLDEILRGQDSERTRQTQETFAQTAEDYFLKGKFKDSRAKRLMDKMKEWMIKHFNALRNLKRKYPTLEITPKVEGMFDSIFAATRVANDEVYSMFPDMKFTPAELGPKASEYMAAYYDARSEATANTYGKSFNRSINERNEIFESKFAELTAQAESEIDTLPSMILRSKMQDVYTEYKTKGGEDPRISYDSAKDFFYGGDDVAMQALKKAAPYFMITGKKKGGLDAAMVMDMIGLNDRNEFIALLTEAGQRDEMINELTGEKLAEAAPLLKTDNEIHDIAVDEVQKKGRAKLIKDEFKIFYEQYPTQFMNATKGLIDSPEKLNSDFQDMLKLEAAQIVGSSPAPRFGAKKFLAAANKHRNDAGKAFKGKDFERAILSSINEAKNYFAFIKGLEAQTALAKARSRINRLAKITTNQFQDRTWYNISVAQTAVAQIQRFNNALPLMPLTAADFAEGTPISADAIEALNNALRKVSFYPGGQGLTVDGALAVGDFARLALTTSRLINQATVAGKKVELEAAVSQDLGMIQDTQTVSFLAKGQTNIEGDLEWSHLSRARASNSKLRGVLANLFKNDAEFAVSNIGQVMGEIQTAEATMDVEKRAIKKKLYDITKKFPTSVGAKIISPARFGRLKLSFDTKTPLFWDKYNFKFQGTEELMAAMFYMGSQSGAQKFLFGNTDVTPANFNVAVEDFWTFVDGLYAKKALDKTHFEFLQSAWETLEDVGSRITPVLRRNDGIEMGYIEGWKVKTPVGEMKGGYYPVVTSKDTSIEDFQKILDGGSDKFSLMKAFPSKDTTMAKTRTDAFPEVALSLNTLDAYIEAGMNVIHLREPLTTFSKYVMTPAMKDFLDSKRPGLIQNVIEPWMKRVKLQEFRKPADKWDGFDSFLGTLRKNAGVSIFLGNYASALRQLLGAGRIARVTNPVSMSYAVSKIMSSPVTSVRDMLSKSSVMKDRFMYSQTKYFSNLDEVSKINDLIGNVGRGAELLAYMPMQIMQNLTDTVAWHSAYHEASSPVEGPDGVKTQMTENQMISYANNVVLKTGGSSNITEMPNTAYGDNLRKILTMFSTEPLINYEMVNTDLQRNKSNINKAKALSLTLLTGIAGMAAIDSLITESKRDAEDEERKKKGKRSTRMDDRDIATDVLRRSVGASFEAFAPVAGKIPASLLAYGRFTLSPASRELEKSAENLTKGITDMAQYGLEFTPYQQAAAADFMTLLTGQPFSIFGDIAVDKFKDMSKDEYRRYMGARRKVKRTANKKTSSF